MDIYNKLPKYKIIENDILERINSGEYSENTMLPTEQVLSKKYSCSRVTVRQALNNLSSNGFIRKVQGSGSFVNKSKTIHRTPLLKSFTEEIIELGKVPSTIVNTFSITDAGETISKKIGIAPTDKAYYIERTRYVDNEAVLFERTFMSVDLHPNLSMKILSDSKYKYGESYGLQIDYSSQNISALIPPNYVANYLSISNDQPIIKIMNTTYLKDKTVFDYTELFLHPVLYQLNITKKRLYDF